MAQRPRRRPASGDRSPQWKCEVGARVHRGGYRRCLATRRSSAAGAGRL